MIELAQQEHSKRLPYTTPSGLQIGSRYEPPRHNPMSREDEFWQGVLLGDPPRWTIKRIVGIAVHTALLAILVYLGNRFGV